MQVKDLEKQQSRLKEVFKTQVSNFREACYCLFGYRIDMASQVSCPISHMLHQECAAFLQLAFCFRARTGLSKHERLTRYPSH